MEPWTSCSAGYCSWRGSSCWAGQVVNWLWPETAVRLRLTEPEATVEPVFWVDARAEAAWDSLVGWTLPLAGLLLRLDVAAWADLGLLGGGIYLYFRGRGIVRRLAMQRRGMRIGSTQRPRPSPIARSGARDGPSLRGTSATVAKQSAA
jgi:hypothetical protein